GFRLTKHRGEFVEGTPWAPLVTATIHPSAVLRAPDDDGRRRMYAGLVADLKLVAGRLRGARGRAAAGRRAEGTLWSGPEEAEPREEARRAARRGRVRRPAKPGT